MDSRGLLDVDQAAGLVGVHRVTLYRWARQRRIPCVRLGVRVIRFDPTAIEKFIKQNSTEVRPA
jgi:excisionase family DNA binding protein